MYEFGVPITPEKSPPPVSLQEYLTIPSAKKTPAMVEKRGGCTAPPSATTGAYEGLRDLHPRNKRVPEAYLSAEIECIDA
jgi:hypothetical protein